MLIDYAAAAAAAVAVADAWDCCCSWGSEEGTSCDGGGEIEIVADFGQRPLTWQTVAVVVAEREDGAEIDVGLDGDDDDDDAVEQLKNLENPLNGI